LINLGLQNEKENKIERNREERRESLKLPPLLFENILS